MADPRLAAWRGRRVLVTGHSGFVGSWVATMLLRLGADVVGYAASADQQTTCRAHWLAALGATTVAGDVRDFDALRAAMAGGYQAVIHLAGQPLVSAGYAEPRRTLETNILGSVNVLEAARLCQPAVLVHVTSDKCYRNQGWPWPYREADGLGGGCPYSVSKAAAELVFEGYAALFREAGGLPRSASVRFGNVIGGGDLAAHRLVPDCLAALAQERPVRLRHAAAVRPWQHVLDVARGLLLLADALADGAVAGGEVVNFGPPGDGATASQVAAALAAAWGGGVIEDEPENDLAEEQVLRLDGRKAAAALSWRHVLDIDAAAGWIVRWHRAVRSGIPPAEATVRQVDEFLSGAAEESR